MPLEIIEWLEAIETRRASGRRLRFTAAEFADTVDVVWPNDSLQSFFDDAVSHGKLIEKSGWLCPMPDCGEALGANLQHIDQCPHCKSDYREEGVFPASLVHYQIEGENSRDIRWIIVIHGMNTRAVWQEMFSWKMSHKMKYAAPVLIYKYGWATIDVLALWRHKQLAHELGERIRIAVSYARLHNINVPPDIVAHSFGTRLFALLCDDPEFEDLKFGRVITAGSIVRPDHNWQKLINKDKRIEALLNHVGGRDDIVGYAQYFVPETGPSGRIGFVDHQCSNASSYQFGHSTFFDAEELEASIANGGLWDRFLRAPLGMFSDKEEFVLDSWKPAFAPLRWLGRALGLVLYIIGAIILFVHRRVDP